MTDLPIYDIYARLSPNPEGPEKEVASADRQIRELTEWITGPLRGRVGRIFRDDGISATKKKKRDGFNATLLLGRSARLATWHMDRYIRTTDDLLRVLEVGFTVHCLHSGHLDLSTPAGQAVAKTIVAWAEYEGQQKSLRQKSSHHERAKDGIQWWNYRPFGFNLDGTKHETEAPLVRKIYAELLAGNTLSGIARDLNERGVSTAHGKPWTGSSVRIVVLAPRNAGIATYLKEELGRGVFATLVEEETFRAAVRLVTDPSRLTSVARGKRTSLATGIAECGVCHGAVRIITKGNSTGMKERSYQCRKGHASAHERWVDERIEAIILHRLSGDADVSDVMVESADVDVAGLRIELDALRTKADQYVEMLDDDQMTRDQFETANKRNRAKIAKLSTELGKAGLDNALASLLDVPDLKEHWREQMTVLQRHNVVRQFFDRIVIMPRGVMNVGTMKPGDVEFYVPGFAEPII